MASTYIIVTPFFPSPSNWRGAYCYDFVKALKQARPDWRVEVFVPGKGGDYEVGGIAVHRFKTKQLPSNILPFFFRKYNEKSFLAALASAGITTCDIVICHGHTANFAIYPLAVKGLNPLCKALLHHHDLMSFGLNNGCLHHVSLYNSWIARQLKKLHEQIDLHVFISRLCEKSFRSFPNIDWLKDDDYSAQARGLVGRLSPVMVKDSYVLHNGVVTAIFSPCVKRVKINGTVIIGCVGNFEPEKGQYDLLQAVKGLPVKVRFIGSGSDLERCKRYAKENGIKAEFLPEMRHEELPKFYHSINLFILPTWLDGFGCVYTEAYACGVPFIATTRAGVEELIPEEERDFWLVEPRRPEMLTQKIKLFLAHRHVQHLSGDIDIDSLVKRFADRMLK